MSKKKAKFAIWNGAENRESARSVSQRLLSIIADEVVVLIFVLAARIILSDTFDVDSIGGLGIFSCILVTAMVSGGMELIDCKINKHRTLIKASVLPVGLGVLLLFIWIFMDFGEVIGGYVNFASEYIDKWNVYYKTAMNIDIYEGGNVELAIGFTVVVFIVILVWFGKCKGCRLQYVIMPVLAIAAGVVVGYAPNATPCVMMLVGILLANAFEYDKADFVLSVRDRAKVSFYKRYIYMVVVAICISLGCMGVRSLVTPKVMDTLKYSSDVKAMQKNLLENFSLSQLIKDIGDAVWDRNKGGEIISNTAISYKNVPVIKLYADEKPNDKMYLKGFYGSDYIDGRWYNDADEFANADTNPHSWDTIDITYSFNYIGVRTMLDSFAVDDESELDTLKMKLEYLSGGSETAHIPYFAYTLDGVTSKGDVYYTKAKKRKTIEFIIIQNKLDYENYEPSSDDIEEMWEDWYERYVCEQYLDVPDDMEGIKDIAAELKSQGLEDMKGKPGENRLRAQAAELVVDWFASNMTYTTNPPSLPRGADPVEYFATESREGYCMHYASAAALILREMGVPAKYVSGYYVSVSDFSQSEDGYVGTVMDNAAHAWVEIYLDMIGWVPIEVTTSYANGINPNKDDKTEENSTEEVTVDSDNDIDEETSSESETTKEQASTEEISSVADKETSTLGAGYYGTNNNSVKKSTVVKVVIIALIAIIVPAIVYMVIRISRRKEEKLQRLVKKGRANKAIKDINRRMYVKLKRKGKLIGVKPSDMAYKEALIKTYPQVAEEEWDKYMDIVREMAFSKNDGTKEDMEYCYEIYLRVKKS